MKMKLPVKDKKLILNKATIQHLTVPELNTVNGGGSDAADTVVGIQTASPRCTP